MRSSLLLLIVLSISGAFVSGKKCPPYGDAKTAEDKALNIAKNKAVKVPGRTKLESLPLKMLINSRKGDDSKRFMNGAYVVTTGYLVSHEEQGPESCNCKQSKASNKDGDVHIYLGLKADAEKKDCIVIEITPDFKKVHPEYEELLVDGAEVQVKGYLFFDKHHWPNALTTCKKCTEKAIWRRTCWEIHPVTDLQSI